MTEWVCVCVCVYVGVHECLCVLQSGPWPTLKQSHHSDPVGLHFASLCIVYVCIKSLYCRKCHSINLLLPAHTLLCWWLWGGCTAVQVCFSMWRVLATKGVCLSPRGWVITPLLPLGSHLLLFFFAYLTRISWRCLSPCFAPPSSHRKPGKVGVECNPSAN